VVPVGLRPPYTTNLSNNTNHNNRPICHFSCGPISEAQATGIKSGESERVITVIFEVWPKAGKRGEYLDIIAELKSLLSEIEGFISIERFSSLVEGRKLLSLSFWRDEEAIQQWRALQAHREAQTAGRSEIFEKYRSRVCPAIRDYRMAKRDEAPMDSNQFQTSSSCPFANSEKEGREGISLENQFGQPIGIPIPEWSAPEFPAREVVSGQTCCLEPLDPDIHAEGLYESFAKSAPEESWTYLPYGPFPTFEEFLEWLEVISVREDLQFYVIKLDKESNPVGMASYLRIDPEQGSIEVGHIHFGAPLKQSYAATEAMFLMMQRAFGLGYRRYEWKCDAFNAASCSAAQRFGFSFEGIFRQATMYKGRNRDTAWFSITDREWPTLKDAFLTWMKADNFDDQGNQLRSLRSLTQPLLNNVISVSQDSQVSGDSKE